ncbi:probable tubulin polyglutamylase TTLL9 isoform X4 [Dunckerocampus dactyliophorus]|uniref:probable tubulin polyglutamylase TTLL9 isoform X4 n=1 Tax=Dunckerocampus dactyliophorus TaxID=161453 RepID=UPI00240620EB|nr:probable tubulin polyglutamylase TTLL9 isoform X4 [Dunckerocampus dactyliophorus]
MSLSKNKTSVCKTFNDCRKPTEKWEGRCVVYYKCGLLGTIHDVLKQRPGWVEVKDDGEWDFQWCEVGWLRENFDHSYMEEHARINHFRNHYELTRKDFLLKNLKRYKRTLEREASCTNGSKCDFFPCSFALPNEYHLFVEEFKRNPGSTWIMKPAAKSQGAGIFLFKKLKDIMDWRKHDGTRSKEQKDAAQVESYVAQRYIENPYLLGGRKFDLRVYVMVTSYFPLKAWLYREGFARLSSTRFCLNSIDDKYVHLTNVAVQKTAPDYDPEKGCKWKLQKLRMYLTAKHGRQMVETLFKEMDNIIIISLQSVQKIIINDKHCFELYGYDIMLDENLKPLTGKEKRVGGYDLMWNDGPVYREDADPEVFGCSCLRANTYLGCMNDRENQIFKQIPAQKV